MRACTDRYGDMEALNDALDGKNQGKALDEAIWLLSVLMDAGARYARLNGETPEDPLDADALYDVLGADDLGALNSKIAETIVSGKTATVEAQPPKNGKATPSKK